MKKMLTNPFIGWKGSNIWERPQRSKFHSGRNKNGLQSGNACYHSVQNLLRPSLLSKNIKMKIYRTIILTEDLYGRETQSLTLSEERRLRVFENRVLRRLFEPKTDEVTGEWRKLHLEELNDLYSQAQYCSGDPIEKNEIGGACGTYGGGERCIQGFGRET